MQQVTPGAAVCSVMVPHSPEQKVVHKDRQCEVVSGGLRRSFSYTAAQSHESVDPDRLSSGFSEALSGFNKKRAMQLALFMYKRGMIKEALESFEWLCLAFWKGGVRRFSVDLMNEDAGGNAGAHYYLEAYARGLGVDFLTEWIKDDEVDRYYFLREKVDTRIAYSYGKAVMQCIAGNTKASMGAEEIHKRLSMAIILGDPIAFEKIFEHGCLADRKHEAFRILNKGTWPRPVNLLVGERINIKPFGLSYEFDLLSRVRIEAGFADLELSHTSPRLWFGLWTEFVAQCARSDRLAEVFHATWVMAQLDPSFEILLYKKHQHTSRRYSHIEAFGAAFWEYNKVVVTDATEKDCLNKGVFAHEFVHILMYLLYDNESKPYKKDDTARIKAFKSVRTLVKRALADLEPFYTDASLSMNDMRGQYKRKDYSSEYVARALELDAIGKTRKGNDPVLKPILEYWDTYVRPDLRAFIETGELLLRSEN